MLKIVAWGIAIYPAIAHLGLWLLSPRLAIFYLLTLLLISLLYPPRFRKTNNLFIAAGLFLGVSVLALNNLDHWLIYLPPFLIPCLLMMLFINSLKPMNEPIVTRFARSIETVKLTPEREQYTKRVTQLWAAVFAFMSIQALLLAIFSSIEIWSLATHIGNYVLITLVITGEFIYRGYKFKTESDSFINFISALSRYRWN